jgi:FKBP-type peptidyl-prolyl cis-trans isomerase
MPGWLKNKLFIINLLCCLSVSFIWVSCGSESPYKGYDQTESGLYYKLISIGDGKRRPSIGSYLELGVTYRTEKDSVFLDSYSSNDLGRVILPFNHSSFPGSFEEGLSTMNEGDSMSFIVPAKPLFEKFFKSSLPMFLDENSMVKIDVKLQAIFDKEQYLKEINHYRELVEDRDIEEQRRLLAFLDTVAPRPIQTGSGIYYTELRKGRGEAPQKGQQLQIHYVGSFLNGKIFESTYERGLPMEFTFGEQGQVIRGLEAAISLLKEGGKTKFIIPSHLAYGATGSSTGIVPPYTSVIYEIELLKLTK